MSEMKPAKHISCLHFCEAAGAGQYMRSFGDHNRGSAMLLLS
jgi:hypothetical protein